ncbi:cadmium resistance transporter [Ruoffia tabacinasalis]
MLGTGILIGGFFTIGIAIMSALYALSMINETIEKYVRIILALVFTPLSFYIKVKNRTLQHI